MNKFLEAHKDNIHGTLSCAGRIIFKGHSALSWAGNMTDYLSSKGVLIKDFKAYARRLSRRLREHALKEAERAGRPYFTPSGKYDKEKKARHLAEKDNIQSGLVCVISALESSPTFKMVPGKGKPRLVNASVPQLCVYYYIMHPKHGLMRIRIQTWLPFTVQIYINGHEWLARRMAKLGIDYEQAGNSFTRIGDIERAQCLADDFMRIKWEKELDKLAAAVNPLSGEEDFPGSYYWVMDQVEYATDILFKDSRSLEALYEKLLERAILRFGPKDVLTFLGKKFDGRFTGDQINSLKKRDWGGRIKHWVKRNWMKMYKKHGSVPRVETVFNDPYHFKVLRHGKRHGQWVYGWYPMSKGVANMPRHREIGLAANGAYLDALAVEPDPRPAKESLERLTRPVTRDGHKHGGLNPLREDAIKIFKAVMSGDYAAFGFQNREIRGMLFGSAGGGKAAARLSARTGRLLGKLRAHKLIAKIPRSRRWRVTEEGWAVMSAAVEIYEKRWAQELDRQAA